MATFFIRSSTSVVVLNVSAPNTPRPRGKEHEVLVDSEIFIDGWGLEFPPDAGTHDGVTVRSDIHGS